MTTTLQGELKADGLKFAIIAARFNSFITDSLVDGALDALVRHGAKEADITLIKTPGAFEIPNVLKHVAGSKKFDAIICLGAVIRGGTPHFDYVASEVSKGVAQVSLDTGLPISFGVLTCDTVEQAIDRAGTKSGNKGFESAVSAIEMANLIRQL